MTPLIFLSYAHEDIHRVQLAYRALVDAGLRPWMDKPPAGFDLEGIAPGQDWDSVVRAKLSTAHLVLAFFSSSSIAKRGYVQREYRLALDLVAERPPNTVCLIPVLLEPCELPDLRVGQISLSQLQHFKLYESGLDTLVLHLSRIVPFGSTATELNSLVQQLTRGVKGAENRLRELRQSKRLQRSDPKWHASEIEKTQGEIGILKGWLHQLGPGHEHLQNRIRQIADEVRDGFLREQQQIEEEMAADRRKLQREYASKFADLRATKEEARRRLVETYAAKAAGMEVETKFPHFGRFRSVPNELKTKTQWRKLGRCVTAGALHRATVYSGMAKRDVELYDIEATVEVVPRRRLR